MYCESFRKSIVSLCVALGSMTVMGCGQADSIDDDPDTNASVVRDQSTKSKIRVQSLGSTKSGENSLEPTADAPLSNRDGAPQEKSNVENQPAAVEKKPARGLSELIGDRTTPFVQNRMKIDAEQVKAAGISAIEGKFVTIYSDVRGEKSIAYLCDVFDQAVPQWCEYFQVDPEKVKGWKLSGFIILSKERFRSAGLLPDTLPPFKHGYSRGFEFWVYYPLPDYYLRHQVLHEGTHAFMLRFLGGFGPPWYSEGMAELIACHRWDQNRLTLNYTFLDKDECQGWRRVELIRKAFAENKAMSLVSVLRYDSIAHLEIEPYAWCWAACAFLDRHPKFQKAFRSMTSKANDRSSTFNVAMLEQLRDSWPEVVEQWQLFVSEMDYGVDVTRSAVEYRLGSPLKAEGQTMEISVDRGWQSTGIKLEAGLPYRLVAKGRYQVGDQPKIWWCEPPGVTINYYDGQPLGMLIAAVRPDTPTSDASPLLAKIAIGAGRTLQLETAGTLYLKINESPAHLGDNKGTLQVNITKALP